MKIYFLGLTVTALTLLSSCEGSTKGEGVLAENTPNGQSEIFDADMFTERLCPYESSA